MTIVGIEKGYVIAKNYWSDDAEHFVINVLKFEKQEWGYLHGVNHGMIPLFTSIDRIFYHTEGERDSKFERMALDGWTVIDDFEAPDKTHDYTQDVQWTQMRSRD